MDQPIPAITIELLTVYAAADAVQIGQLMPTLSKQFTSEPIPESLLRAIIDSPYHDQLVARDETGRIVGTATLSIIMGAGVNTKAYLEDFVVDPEVRGAGIGGKLWDAMLDWAREHGANKLNFTSSAQKGAQAFYLKRGAVIRDTSYFKKDIL